MHITAPEGVSPGPALPGFEDARHFWITKRQRYAVKVMPGDFYVTRNDELIVTTLGSCISACVRDPAVGIGGMNHFILPDLGDLQGVSSGSNRYGAFAMEQLINTVLKFGGRRERLEIKITGGGKMLGKMADIGQKNIDFIHDFLCTEGLNVISWDVGGQNPRKVMYIPREGRMLVKKLESFNSSHLIEAEVKLRKTLDTQVSGGDVELF